MENSKQIKEHFSDLIDKIGLQRIKFELGKNYIHINDLAEVLFNTILTGENCILYGPGGYGKSEVTIALLEICEIPYTKIQCFEGMAPEELIGPPNMKKLQEESILEYNFEASPFNKGHVIVLEEMLDARPQTLAVMKDIITSENFQGHNTKNASIIVCTNSDPKHYYGVPAVKALLSDRFIFKYNVVWDSIINSRYSYLIKNVLKDEISKDDRTFIANLCYFSGAAGQIVSPRAAIKIAKIVTKAGYTALKHIDEIDSSTLEEMLSDKREGPLVASACSILRGMIAEIHYASSEYFKDNIQKFLEYGDVFKEATATKNSTLIELGNSYTSKFSMNSIKNNIDTPVKVSIEENEEYNEILLILKQL